MLLPAVDEPVGQDRRRRFSGVACVLWLRVGADPSVQVHVVPVLLERRAAHHALRAGARGERDTARRLGSRRVSECHAVRHRSMVCAASCSSAHATGGSLHRRRQRRGRRRPHRATSAARCSGPRWSVALCSRRCRVRSPEQQADPCGHPRGSQGAAGPGHPHHRTAPAREPLPVSCTFDQSRDVRLEPACERHREQADPGRPSPIGHLPLPAHGRDTVGCRLGGVLRHAVQQGNDEPISVLHPAGRSARW